MRMSSKDIFKIPNYINYWRKPTKDEIKFGFGANHYRDFQSEKCFDEDALLKLRMKSSDDKLIYHYSGQEYSFTSKAKLSSIKIE